MNAVDWILCGAFAAFIVYMTVIEPRAVRGRVIYDVTGDLTQLYVQRKRKGLN